MEQSYPRYNSNPQQQSLSSKFWGFEQGLTTDTKHSIRQDESFGRHRPANVNSGQYSDSRQYDSQNNQRLNKDYVLVSKKEKNGYKSKNVMINQMKVIE